MASGDVVLEVVTSVASSGTNDSGYFPYTEAGTPRSYAGWEAVLSGTDATSGAKREVTVKAVAGGQDAPLSQSKQYRITITEV